MNIMSNPTGSTVKELERNEVRRITQAPLRMAGTFDFAVPAEVLFPRISEPAQMAAWFPLLKGGKLDHATSQDAGDWGEGSKRQCYTNGMGTLYETIHYWDAPNAYTYEVKNFMMPITDHLALMAITPNGRGGVLMTWHQYFNLKGIAMRHMFPTMMLGMMNKGMATLAKDLGGEGGRITRV
ncbi:SRPBCC family protein [Sulfitobacter sp. S190]|uniref:SRPBCC family protein n=1 Tax=Sulfitobacter sp. S190 TaxID=2867022 RepID=UPI0021A74C8E|nr:SRPBCC family protein [Sulfitobacter sp. S190]UWR21745.1 SRPBCC family protein [Sulfitobacter sp. S190]